MGRVSSIVLLFVVLFSVQANAEDPSAPGVVDFELPELHQACDSLPAPSHSRVADSVVPPLTSDYQWYRIPADQPVAADPVRILPGTDRFSVHGWLDGGILGNTSNPASHFNGPYNSVAQDRITFNQAYLIAELRRPEGSDFGIGGRVDVLYGADYLVAQSVGFEKNSDGSPNWNSNQYYGLALPQAYVEVGNDTLSVRVGHFYTVVGYEGVPSANNFFYSHAYSYQFAGPFTEWGGLLTWKPTDQWEIQAGPVNQWNTLNSVQNSVAFLGRAKYTSSSKDWWSSFAIVTGDESNNAAGLPGIVPDNANRTRYSFIVDRQLSSNLEYVFHHWLGAQQNGTASGGTATWYGIDQYLFYKISSKLKLGGRFEWFRDQDGTRVGLTLPSNPNVAPLPGNYYSITFGPNYTPHPNVVIRPEIRYDTYQGSSQPFDDGQQKHQLMLGADVIVHF